MRSTQFKRPVLVLLVLTLVFALCVPAFAAESAADSLLTLEARTRVTTSENQVVVKINTLQSGAVTDGKLTVAYDGAALHYAGVSTGAAWGANTLDMQVNDAHSGELTFAFAANTASAAGNLFILTFDVQKTGYTDVSVDAAQSYLTGIAQSPAASITVEAGGHDWSDWTILKEAGCGIQGSKQRQCHTCGKVDVRVIPADCPSSHYTDLNTAAWYHESVDYVLAKGLMVGTSTTEFAPYETVTRAQMVAILYRMAGSPESTAKAPFTDVPAGAYYADAVNWAYANGICAGVSASSFAPGEALSREQMVTFLYRYAKFAGMDDGEKTIELDGFQDAGQISGYALASMQWACASGLIAGTSETTLSPKDPAQRVQIAAVVMRLLTKVQD